LHRQRNPLADDRMHFARGVAHGKYAVAIRLPHAGTQRARREPGAFRPCLRKAFSQLSAGALRVEEDAFARGHAGLPELLERITPDAAGERCTAVVEHQDAAVTAGEGCQGDSVGAQCDVAEVRLERKQV